MLNSSSCLGATSYQECMVVYGIHITRTVSELQELGDWKIKSSSAWSLSFELLNMDIISV